MRGRKITGLGAARRICLHFAAGALMLLHLLGPSCAQTYPTKSLRLVVGYPAGGVADIAARLIGQSLSQRLGQQIVIENRAGAAGNIAAEIVVRAAPDGYTLLMCTNTNTINDSLYRQLSFKFARDIVPVALVADTPLVMAVNRSFPATSVPSFIAYARMNPGKINFASAGSGTAPHITGEMFKLMAGVDLVHVPYRGDSPALADLIGGQVQVYFVALGSSIEYLRGGKLRPLAVAAEARLDLLPEVPALNEFLPGFTADIWVGLCAPKGTPSAVIVRLGRETNESLAESRLRARFADLGMGVRRLSPAEFGNFISDETRKWARVIRAANLSAD
jgi:tripartite-type tricarboxylate transporter receptor subunit TctC